MNPTDWIYGLMGGLMIGWAASMYLLINGRIMGASGIVGSLIDGASPKQHPERIAFLLGVFGAPAIAALIYHPPETHISANAALVILAGLLVGFGSRMANGCTSGHGVCGISRLSRRGIGATVVYLLFGGLTMLVARHVMGVL